LKDKKKAPGLLTTHEAVLNNQFSHLSSPTTTANCQPIGGPAAC